jgi:N6-adenosine-specific RNA methylase IME4
MEAKAKEPYRCIVADPPWPFRDRLPGKGRGAVKHYKIMSIDAICAFALPPIDNDALLFLWKVGAMPEEALRVVRAWGFVPKGEIIWVKTHEKPDGTIQTFAATGDGLEMGMGHYVRYAHETCIVALRRRGRPKIQDHAVRSVFFAPIGRHSEKPEIFYQQVRRLALGPRAELFTRAPHDGFDAYGDQVEPREECA